MKKLIVLALVVLGLLAYAGSDRYGVSVLGVDLAFDPIGRMLDRKSKGFLSDIQFKAFERAAQYHAPEDRSKRDIPKLIEDKFAVKPEALDIRHFEVLRVDVSEDGARAKSLCQASVKFLNTDQLRDFELVLYWKKVGEEWWLDLQSSL